MINQNKETLNKLIQLITRHGFNNYMQSKVEQDFDPKCRYCGEYDEETWHLVMDCGHFTEARNATIREGLSSDTALQVPHDLVKLPRLIPHLEDVLIRQRETTEVEDPQGVIVLTDSHAVI